MSKRRRLSPPQLDGHYPLLSLADELLLNILEQIDSKKDLCSLACTCFRLQGLVEPFIWRSLLILSGGHATQIASSVQKREERTLAIRSLQIRYPQHAAQGIENLNPEMKKMLQLRELTVESSCPNNTGVWDEQWGIGGIKCAEFLAFASRILPGPNPRVQIPLQRCTSAYLSCPN
jgi:hypothetical protein